MSLLQGQSGQDHLSVKTLGEALFVVNKHAKTAPSPKLLYDLKRQSLQKLLKEGIARKIGLHFSDNPKFSVQQSDVLIEIGEYAFHLPPSKEDMKQLPHLGNRTSGIRNPKASLSLSKARSILQSYVGSQQAAKESHQKGSQPAKQKPRSTPKNHQTSPFTSTFLGTDTNFFRKEGQRGKTRRK